MWAVVLGSLLFSLAATANVSVTAKIHDIDYGKNGEPTYLLLTSGDVVWLRQSSNKSKTGLLELAKYTNRTIRFTLDGSNDLISSKILRSASADAVATEAFFGLEDFYAPTIVEGPELAAKYFSEARHVYRSSQCFNRAHVWSYEWFKNHGVLSNKTWIFFTRRYIREYNYNWWFHVAPSIAVREGAVVREKVMDLEFSSEPQTVQTWTNEFMKDKAVCPRVMKYSDYANYPESESCYTMRTSMFYHQPFDLESNELFGTSKINWVEEDLKQAYLETFEEEF